MNLEEDIKKEVQDLSDSELQQAIENMYNSQEEYIKKITESSKHIKENMFKKLSDLKEEYNKGNIKRRYYKAQQKNIFKQFRNEAKEILKKEEI